MFPAREAFFLGCSDDNTIIDESRGAVMIEGGDAEDAHAAGPRSKDGVDEWGDGRALRQHDQRPEHRHQDEDGKQPVLLAGPEEAQEFFQE